MDLRIIRDKIGSLLRQTRQSGILNGRCFTGRSMQTGSYLVEQLRYFCNRFGCHNKSVIAENKNGGSQLQALDDPAAERQARATIGDKLPIEARQ
jgi:hypothetical protein